MWEGHLWRGLVGTAWEDDEGAVGGPCARHVLGVCEDHEQARAQALAAIYARERVDGRGRRRVGLEIVCEGFELGRGRCRDAGSTFEWEACGRVPAAKRFDETGFGWFVLSRTLDWACIQSRPFSSNLPWPRSKSDMLMHDRRDGCRRHRLLHQTRCRPFRPFCGYVCRGIWTLVKRGDAP